VGLNSLKSLNLTNVYPNNNKNKKNNNKVKSKPLGLRSRAGKKNDTLFSCVDEQLFLGKQRESFSMVKLDHPYLIPCGLDLIH
jgi:hypothetical protein